MATEKRLIDANALLKRHCKEPSKGNCKECEWWGDSWGRCEIFGKLIDLTHTVDAVEVIHGHWIAIRDKKFGGSLGLQCSVCRSRTRNKGGNYCSNCGATMDGDGDG